MMRYRAAGVIFLTLFVLLMSASGSEQLSPVHLRTEYLSNPLGIDTPTPRFLWWMKHAENNQKQTAYEIVVATSLDELDGGMPYWDSGKVLSDNSIHVEYAGPPLRSFVRYYWKVRTWDVQDRVSSWSEPAWFEMGLLRAEDFRARWIRGPQDAKQHVGYQSRTVGKADETQWVQLDLGGSDEITTVILYPATKKEGDTTVEGFGFPLRYRLEFSDEDRFTSPKYTVDSGETDVPNPGGNAVTIRLETPISARYVRLSATRLYERKPGSYVFALAELRLLGTGQKVLSLGKSATCSTTQESEQHGISLAYLTDGICNYVGESLHSPLLRKGFSLREKVTRARAYVSALGYYELYLNGQRIGDHVLDPADTVRTKRALYSVYDVTDAVRSGENAIGLMLGHGWHYGTCAAWLQLRVEYADGGEETVVTDESWRTTVDGPIREESLYHGETYDARKEIPGWAEPGFQDTDWAPAVLYEEPPRQLNNQSMPPICVVERRHPIQISRLDADTQIVDFGQNLTGWLRIRVEGNAGREIVMRHAEVLYPDGTLNPSNLRSARATDRYILKGSGEEVYAPRFTQHGFRYAEIKGYPRDLKADDIQAEVVHTDFPVAGWFSTTSPVLNAIRDMTRWSIRANSMSHPTDCPQRDERMGWMGDAHLAAESTIMNYDAAAYYENWLRCIADSQSEEGYVPDVAPYLQGRFGRVEGSPPWAIAYPLITWYLYRYYGDVRAVSEHYENIKRWFSTMEKRAKEDIVEYCEYGDWVGLEETPGPLISTGVYYWTARILEEFASVLGKEGDRVGFAERAARISDAFNRSFWNEKDQCYGNGSQFSQIWPLYLGIAQNQQKTSALQHLIRDIEEKRNGHLATGILGTKYLFDVLKAANREDLAFRLVFQQDFPSWGYMLNHGATTLWELWNLETDNKMNSHNHQMFGGILGWMVDVMGGIGALPEPGFHRIEIAPRIPDNLGGAQTRLDSVRGEIACDWRRDEDRFWMRVSVPPNSEAVVTVPRVKQEGRVLLNNQELPNEAEQTSSGWKLTLGSGDYIFTVN